MIDRSMLKRLAEQCGIDITHENLAEFQAFAKACYAAGQDAQRERDIEIAWKYHTNGIEAIEYAIRANKGE